MKLIVFGASGKVGRLLVQQALAAGHDVSAFVRNPANVAVQHPALTVAAGDVTDPVAVEAAIRGQDVVFSTVGWTKTSTKDILTTGARNIVAAMKRNGVKRLVSLVGAGVGFPQDPSSVGRSVMLTLMKLLVRGMLEDAEGHAEIIRASNLDWTLVRPPRLLDTPPTGVYEAGYLKLGPGHKISRADVAAFMLRVGVANEYLREAPMVTS